jgi:phosphohistidine phosphatase
MTQLLIIRHGLAVDAETFRATGSGDDERPLTDEGVAEMMRVAAALQMQVPKIDLLASSPLARARQTAEIVARPYGIPIGATVDELRPGSPPEAFVEWARRQAQNRVLGIVGHDPQLARLVIWFISGADGEGIALEKGGACLVDFDAAPERAAGTLLWLMTPLQIIDASGPE